MKNPILYFLLCLCLFSFAACSDQEEEVDLQEVVVNPVRAELEQLIEENNVTQLWAVSVDVCSEITFYDGSKDFEFTDQFLRIQDSYFIYDRLVSFQIDSEFSTAQMLLCFN